MAPLFELSNWQNGKFELKQRQVTKSAQVCAEFDAHALLDAYFLDAETRRRFYVLSLDDVVSVNVGLYNGEAWYRWVWMWESTKEADEAWSRAPADLEQNIEQLVQKIDGFIRAVKRNAKPESKSVLDITPELEHIGWEMTILEYTPAQVAGEYELSRRVREKKV